ncbi:MAG: hypothetical protein KAG53_07635 [Endozoicomonadaceae bacterium]|nr:hypothetical protein [Endozoicomonadaceae bacterium]
MALVSLTVNSYRLSIVMTVSILTTMILFACSASAEKQSVYRTALDDYVHQIDNKWDWDLKAESWQTVPNITNAKVKVYQVSMVSQYWAAGAKHGLSNPLWKHRLTIYQPNNVRSKKALLLIDGGIRYSRDSETVDPSTDLSNRADWSRIAANTGAVVVELKDVPNQYLSFSDGIPRKEDDLVAWTWHQFLQNPDENERLPLQFPMVKSVVRAMDTVQALMSYKGVKIESFVLAGASKRGWAAWLTAAVDARTDSLMPTVIDMLNIEAFADHVDKIYQKPIPALKDYYSSDRSIASYIHSPEMIRLSTMIDPYSYRNRLTMPKYIITASGDDFFPPDSTRLYLDDLKGPTWQRVLPNSRHYVFHSADGIINMMNTIEAFLGARVENRMLPSVSWSSIGPGQLSASMATCPKHATLWRVTNPKARDFRMTELSKNGLQYDPKELTINDAAPCQFDITIAEPKSGWTAWFVELSFDNAPYPDIVMTSTVSVIPDVYPKSCHTSRDSSDTCTIKD